MLINVRRHPYSFLGDARGVRGGYGAYVEGQESDWNKGLLGTCNGDVTVCEKAKRDMVALAHRAGISTLRYDVKTNWQPVNSQRMLLWATRRGKGEEYMKALGRKHFEEAKSASHSSTILDAAEEAGLERGEAEAFLKTDELSAEVWKSYGSTIKEKGIHAIPYFVFNSPLSDAGPFKSGKGDALIVNGSGDEQQFEMVFEQLLAQVDRLAAAL
eukprot:gnl/MRDRNA2_/MRDRNA2_32005_c0_seq1.p1 gnl/MRDRNA2_/MRDRNA2_32005_c0~~gnl/MRDRNA2_/MRDRNA2_32005_c0_seq1.p1  ORF type:complete len:214 (+),score=45.51 gnl/MRDRNA2_/MRDRNA2_32005_c0_seq1:562-1203(+)